MGWLPECGSWNHASLVKSCNEIIMCIYLSVFVLHWTGWKKAHSTVQEYSAPTSVLLYTNSFSCKWQSKLFYVFTRLIKMYECLHKLRQWKNMLSVGNKQNMGSWINLQSWDIIKQSLLLLSLCSRLWDLCLLGAKRRSSSLNRLPSNFPRVAKEAHKQPQVEQTGADFPLFPSCTQLCRS